MSEQQDWQSLHRRVAAGETLSVADQAAYDAACRDMDAAEELELDGSLERLRSLRAQIAEAEAEQQQLQEQERHLNARIAALEARLDVRTRQLLGIGG